MAMTVVGKRSGVISLGLGCQTAFQLLQNKDFIGTRLGENLQYQSSFFNWLLSDSSGIASFIEEYAGKGLSGGDLVRSRAPESPLQVAHYRLWLWHEKESGSVCDEDLGRITSKYDYLLRKFWSFRNLYHRYFIIGNSQNNLEEVAASYGHIFQVNLSEHQISRIERAVNSAFPGGRNTFYYVCYPERTDSCVREAYYAMPRDSSEWTGSTENWRSFLDVSLPRPANWLETIFRRRNPATAGATR
jgi:hypothetical protein